jgi:spermidine synthase
MIRADRPLLPLACLFAASGAAGLCHEVAWARSLSQSLGSSLQALSAVLVAFLGGLGIGAWIGGRLAKRWRSPLLAYAALEIAIGLWGISSPVLASLPGPILERIGPAFADGWPLAGLRLALALLVLGPAAAAMGATLPFLARAALGDPRATVVPPAGPTAGESLSVLYGSNTLGGALGACAGSFVLLPLLGGRLTWLAAGGLNLLAGGAALALARFRFAENRDPADSGDAPQAPVARRTGARSAPGLACLAASLSGLAGALLQIGWTRITALSFGSTVYALGTALTAYLLGLGAGPLLARRAAGRIEPARLAATLQAGVGIASILLLPLLGRLPVLAAAISGRAQDHPGAMMGAAFVLIVAMLLPPTLAQGATFAPLFLLAGGRSDPDRASGRVYAASTCGSVAGFLLSGFVTLPRFGTHWTLVAASTVALGVAALLVLAPADAGGEEEASPPAAAGARSGRHHGVPAPAAALLLLVSAPALAFLLPPWDPGLVTSGGFLYGPIYRAARGTRRLPEVMRLRGTRLFEEDDGTGVVTVRRSAAGILSLQINGKTEASTGGDLPTQILAAHLPLLVHPGPADLLVVGLASGITLGAAETHAVRSIRVVEIAPAVVRAARLFDGENRHALDDPRATITIDDARSWLLARSDSFDVITSQPSNPWVAGVSNLFTVEFYRLARRHLRPGGVFCQWVQAYRLAPEDLRGIVRSFLTIFPGATLWEESAGGGDYFLIGGGRPVVFDPARLASKALAGVRDDLRRAGIDHGADLLARYVCGPAGLRAFSAGARLLTDDDLYLEWSAPLALFRDTLRPQAVALGRVRETPLEVLPPGAVERDPTLAAVLSRLLRLRDDRLQTLQGLRDADLWTLGDPFLAAGLEDLRSGRYAEAAAALARAAASQPESGNASLLLAEAYRGAGLASAACLAYREAAARDPSLAPAWNGLGRCFASVGRPDEAGNAFTRALALDGHLASARNNLGAILLESGRTEEAERAFRAAVESDPSLAPAQANLGVALKRRGDRRGAERAYRAALDLDPLNLDARFDLAGLLEESGRTEESRTELSRLLAIDPSDRGAQAALRRLSGEQATERGPERRRGTRPETPRGRATPSPPRRPS